MLETELLLLFEISMCQERQQGIGLAYMAYPSYLSYCEKPAAHPFLVASLECSNLTCWGATTAGRATVMEIEFQSKEHLLGAGREHFRQPEEPFRESSEQVLEDVDMDLSRGYMEPAQERSEQLREARERTRERREAAAEHRDSVREYKGAAKLSRAQAKANREQARERRSSRKSEAAGTAANEPRRGPKSCSSHYKGVTKHRRTGRCVTCHLIIAAVSHKVFDHGVLLHPVRQPHGLP